MVFVYNNCLVFKYILVYTVLFFCFMQQCGAQILLKQRQQTFLLLVWLLLIARVVVKSNIGRLLRYHCVSFSKKLEKKERQNDPH